MKRRCFLNILIFLALLFCVTFVSCEETPQPKSPEQFTVTVTGGTGGGKFDKGALCTLSATLNADEVFEAWIVDGKTVSTANPYVFAVECDVTIAAKIKEKEIPVPELELGAFARKWIGKEKDCGILDLENRTWSIWNSFEVTSVSGSNNNTVISCIADGDMNYRLTLTENGELKATDVDYPQLNYTFMPSADSFNGVWALEEDEVYALFVSEPNDDLLFGWALVNADGTIDEDYLVTACTKLVFDSDGNAVVQFVNAFNITYSLVADDKLVVEEEDLTYTPTADLFAYSYVSENGVTYSPDFTNGKIRADGEEFDMSLQSGRFGAGLYFSDSALIYTLDGTALYTKDGKEPLRVFAFAGSYTNGSTTLTVGDNLAITVGSVKYTDGVLTALKDFDRVDAVAPSGLAGIQQTAIVFDRGTKYLIWIKGGVAIAVGGNGNYEIQSAFFNYSQLQLQQAEFEAGLSSAADVYTTGGTNRLTIGFEFENGNVLLNGVAVPFVWSYVIKPSGDEYAVITFVAEVFGSASSCVLYPYFDYGYLRLETVAAVGSGVKEPIRNLVSLSEYRQLLGTSYYVSRDGYVESICFEQDGTLVLTRGKQGNFQRYSDYELTRDDISDVLVVTFTELAGIKFEVSVFCDKIGVSVNMITDVYVNESLLSAFGSYYDSDGKKRLDFLSDRRSKYDVKCVGVDAPSGEMKDITVSDGRITCVYNDCILDFFDGKVTIRKDGGETLVYNKEVNRPTSPENIPAKFIGKYCDGEGRVFVEVLSDNAFLYNIDIESEGVDDSTQPIKFDKVTVDQDRVICEKTYDVGVVPLTVIFVFEGDSVTVTENNHEPFVYSKQA